MNDQTQQIILVILIIFQVLIAAGLTWIIVKIRNLTKDVKKGNLVKVLEKVLKKEEDNSRDLRSQQKQIKSISDDIKLHIQKVGLIRFNPFEEMGGDHSFSLALLDEHDTGVVMTGLHTRDRTRVYLKDIVKGKCKIDLSSEEEKALSKAIKSK
jgi:hypothetical protein